MRVGDPLYLGLFGLALARIAGIPLVIRVNGNNDEVRRNTGQPMYPQLFRSARVEQAIERFVFPRAALVAAPNQDNVDYAVEQGRKTGAHDDLPLWQPDRRRAPARRPKAAPSIPRCSRASGSSRAATCSASAGCRR